jgi:hypothetical protein
MPHHSPSGQEFDANGCAIRRMRIGDIDVVIHYDDVPASDITTVRGIRCTTPLRTVIDMAAELEVGDLREVVDDCLRRRLFTLAEARARLAEPDMQRRPGAVKLRRLLAGRPDRTAGGGRT